MVAVKRVKMKNGRTLLKLLVQNHVGNVDLHSNKNYS